MKLLDRVFSRKSAGLTYDQVAKLIDGNGGSVIAGQAVNAMTALKVSTVLACTKVIADGCATPKLGVFRWRPDGKRERATDIPEHRLLSRRPNEWQTSYEWRRQMTMHAVLCDAALSIKVVDDRGILRELIPIKPGSWDVRRVSRYELRYRCYDQFGLIGDFGPDEVFVLNGLQWDWGESLDAVKLARNAIGLAMAAERSQEAMHENGLRPSGVYSVEGKLSEEQHTRLTAWIKRLGGVGRNNDPLVVDNAAKWTPLTQSGVDSQHLETRRFQVEEICRTMNVFPIMVGHNDKSATFASSEAFFMAHRIHTLQPWHEAWNQRLDETVLDGSGPLFTEFDTRYMQAGTMKDRAEWATKMTQGGIYTRNEVREEEGKDALDGLDEPLTPMNMTQGAKDADPKTEEETGNP